jgi:hypothetical protein
MQGWLRRPQQIGAIVLSMWKAQAAREHLQRRHFILRSPMIASPPLNESAHPHLSPNAVRCNDAVDPTDSGRALV